MLELYLFRHGETDFNKRKLYQGTGLGIPLNGNGRRQAQELSDKFRGREIDELHVSVARRTVQTGGPLAEATGAKLVYSHGLVELSHGPFTNTSYEVLPKEYDSVFDFIFNGPYHGASIEDAEQRGRRHWQKIMDRSGTIGIMSHAGFLSVYCDVLNGQPVGYRPEQLLKNGHFHRFRIGETGTVLTAEYNLFAP